MLRDTSRSRLLLGVLIVLSIALIVLDSREGGHPVTAAARSAGSAVFMPAAKSVSTVAEPVTGFYETLAAAPDARRRIAELRERNTELSRQLAARDNDEGRMRQLRTLLNLSGRGGYTIVPAHAVTRLTVQGYGDTVTLDVGHADGVRSNMTVVNGQGLVGRVVKVSQHTSTLLLITDTGSSVGARLEGSKEIGMITGRSHTVGKESMLGFELMDATASVSKGERIVTLGSYRQVPFVPGVPVGTVDHVEDTPGALTRTAKVIPAVDFSRLDIVGVVVEGPATDPRDSLLPPKPEEPTRPTSEPSAEPGVQASASPEADSAERSPRQTESEQDPSASPSEPARRQD
ncbi:rod shape-determining protein MreC [Salinactinospora qingdaonensis]|uniref:Cell shape-determining protein MreC n=1 Tax=Salinactinospora qingdaonensis TaxID=702744 RepID=A0ABP7EYY4_9ACTN